MGWVEWLVLLSGGKPVVDAVSSLVRFFVASVPGAGRTQIMKFLYLADLEARRSLGRPLTALQYIWFNHGPFDEQLYVCLETLKAAGQIREDLYSSRYGKTAFRYTVPGAVDAIPFGPAEQAILRHVANDIATTPLRDLLDDIVYQTAPMVDAVQRGARGERLRMELVDNEARVPGLDPERAFQSVAQADAGQLATHADVFARLRART